MCQKCLLLQLEKEPQVTGADESHSQCQVTSHESNLKFSRGAGNDKKEVKGTKAFCGAPGHICLNTTSMQEEKKVNFLFLALAYHCNHTKHVPHSFAKLHFEKNKKKDEAKINNELLLEIASYVS